MGTATPVLLWSRGAGVSRLGIQTLALTSDLLGDSKSPCPCLRLRVLLSYDLGLL